MNIYKLFNSEGYQHISEKVGVHGMIEFSNHDSICPQPLDYSEMLVLGMDMLGFVGIVIYSQYNLQSLTFTLIKQVVRNFGH